MTRSTSGVACLLKSARLMTSRVMGVIAQLARAACTSREFVVRHSQVTQICGIALIIVRVALPPLQQGSTGPLENRGLPSVLAKFPCPRQKTRLEQITEAARAQPKGIWGHAPRAERGWWNPVLQAQQGHGYLREQPTLLDLSLNLVKCL